MSKKYFKNEKVYDVVKRIMEDKPTVRDNDKKLMWYVWQEQGYASERTGQLSAIEFIVDAVSPESITRARRMVQQLHPELRATPKIQAERKKRESTKGIFSFLDRI